MNTKLTDTEMNFLTSKASDSIISKINKQTIKNNQPVFIIEKADNGFMIAIINGVTKKMVAKSYEEVMEILKSIG